MGHTGPELLTKAAQGLLRQYVGDTADAMTPIADDTSVSGAATLGDGRAQVTVTVSDVTVSDLFDALADELNGAAKPERTHRARKRPLTKAAANEPEPGLEIEPGAEEVTPPERPQATVEPEDDASDF